MEGQTTQWPPERRVNGRTDNTMAIRKRVNGRTDNTMVIRKKGKWKIVCPSIYPSWDYISIDEKKHQLSLLFILEFVHILFLCSQFTVFFYSGFSN
jgi:hypothetical protein